MTLAEISARITMYTGASAGTSGQFKDSDRLVAVNKAYDDVHVAILSSQDESDFDDANNTTFSFATTSLVSGQQDYSLPSTLLKVKRLEITYDGTNYYKVNPFDVTETGEPTDITSISNNFDKTNPFYDIRDNSILLFPIPDQNVTDGLKIWEDRSLTLFTSGDMTTGTKSPGFNRQFHDVIALKASYDWLLSKTDKSGKIDRIQNKINEMEMSLREFYGNKQIDRQAMFSGGLNMSDFL
jgi:hypothetical protein